MAAHDDHHKEPHHPAVMASLLADDERDRSGRLAHALNRSPNRHGALIRLVAGVLVAVAIYALWRWLSQHQQ
jgi:hypothetical protein